MPDRKHRTNLEEGLTVARRQFIKDGPPCLIVKSPKHVNHASIIGKSRLAYQGSSKAKEANCLRVGAAGCRGLWFDRLMSRSLLTGLTLFAVAVAILCGVPVMVTTFGAQNPGYQCAMAPALPANVELERGATGSLTLWPLGVECRYSDASGEPVIVSSGWFVTWLALTGLVALVAAAALTAVVATSAGTTKHLVR